MPAWLAPMRLVFSPIFEWIWRAGRHVQSRLILRLMTIATLDREDALPVGAAPQAKEGVRATVIAPQRRVTRRVTIDAPRMHKDLERFQKSCPRARIVTRLRRTG
jgi:hypothetical protein